MQRRVVITGLGVVTSIGLTVEEFWRNLCAGRSGVSPIECFDATEYEVKIASEVKNFDPSKWITKREQRRLDRFVQFAVASAAQAVEDAGLEFDKYDPARIGVVGEYFAFCLVPAPVRVGPSRVCPDVSIFSSPIREERSGCIGYKECSAVGDDYLSGVVAAFVGQLGGSGCSVNRGNRCIDVKGYINAVAHCDEAA